jgi:hypothetical protein
MYPHKGRWGQEEKMRVLTPLFSQYKNPKSQSGILSPKPISISSVTTKRVIYIFYPFKALVFAKGYGKVF